MGALMVVANGQRELYWAQSRGEEMEISISSLHSEK